MLCKWMPNPFAAANRYILDTYSASHSIKVVDIINHLCDMWWYVTLYFIFHAWIDCSCCLCNLLCKTNRRQTRPTDEKQHKYLLNKQRTFWIFFSKVSSKDGLFDLIIRYDIQTLLTIQAKECKVVRAYVCYIPGADVRSLRNTSSLCTVFDHTVWDKLFSTPIHEFPDSCQNPLLIRPLSFSKARVDQQYNVTKIYKY